MRFIRTETKLVNITDKDILIRGEPSDPVCFVNAESDNLSFGLFRGTHEECLSYLMGVQDFLSIGRTVYYE